MKIFTIVLSLFTLIATILPLKKSGLWWIRIFDYPRIQIAFFISIAMGLTVYSFGFNYLSTFLLVCLFTAWIFQIIQIAKYTPFYSIQAKKAGNYIPGNTLKIIEANIRMQNDKVVELINLANEFTPDILVVTEPNAWWAEQLKVLEEAYPYTIKNPLENTYGMLLYSKLPLKSTEINYLVTEDIPSFFTTIILKSGAEVDLYCLHPQPPMPGSPTYERDTEILLVGKRVKKSNRPAIVVGDLNDVAWSYTSALFQRYSGLLDPRQGRGLFNTYNVNIPLFRYPLDHFFYSSHFGLIRLERLKGIGSDHYPIFLEICFEESKNHAENKPKADLEDKIEVEQKIEEGRSKS